MIQKYLKDWKVHVLCIILVLIAEFIGRMPFKFGMVSFTLLPMLYVLVFGIILAVTKVIKRDTMEMASPYIGISVMWLIAKIGADIGPNIEKVIKAGPALVLQEFGNLGTIFFALPIAVFIFSMGRQAIGASFSNSREGSLAIVGNMYGLDSPEGQGVMGAYITGTLFGTLFCGILASLLIATNLFHPFALGMAAGTGSSSMMAAALAPVVDAFPDMKDQISAYASTSQVLTSLDGLYMSIFVAIPVTNWLYKIFKGQERYDKKQAAKAKKKGQTYVKESTTGIREVVSEETLDSGKGKKTSFKEIWFVRLKVLLFSGIFASIGNWIATYKAHVAATDPTKAPPIYNPLQVIPALILLLIVVVLGCLIDDLVKAKLKWDFLPTILYISLIAVIFSLPGLKIGSFELGKYFVQEVSKIGLLPLCTPILAYAGISIGKDLDGFKKQGIGIICTALMAFVGTYVGSAIIAQIVLKLTGAI